MFNLMTNVAQNMVDYVKNNPSATGSDGIETKELSAKFTTDCVACCAFGLDGKSFKEEDSEFRQMGRKLLSPGKFMAFKHTLIFLIPELASVLKIK